MRSAPALPVGPLCGTPLGRAGHIGCDQGWFSGTAVARRRPERRRARRSRVPHSIYCATGPVELVCSRWSPAARRHSRPPVAWMDMEQPPECAETPRRFEPGARELNHSTPHAWGGWGGYCPPPQADAVSGVDQALVECWNDSTVLACDARGARGGRRVAATNGRKAQCAQ